MNIDKIEIWVHDHILKNAVIRHFVYGLYQRVLYAISPKMDFEGDVKVITPKDGYEYLFGYYDKCPWSPNGRFMLALRVKSATAKADSTAKAEIVRIDLQADNHVEPLAVTRTWNVQQGCMAQWLDDSTILYNDLRENGYCAVILNTESKEERILDMPVYTLSADKKTALTLDFSRLHRLRPGYGYANLPELTEKEKCPNTPCIWKINIEDNTVTPLLTYTDFAAFEPRPEMENAEHKVNHLMLSPDGKRFMVLHRWFKNKVKYTRLVTCNIDGTGMYNLSDDDFVSHCCWKNDHEILSYLNKKDGGKGYYLLKDQSQEYTRMWPELAMDGHPTYSPDGELVVTDTYPNRRRIQSVYIMKGTRVKCAAKVFSPFKYGGDVRCDLHPRWSSDGRQICFDASFGGKRSVCVINAEKYAKVKNHAQPKFDENSVPKVSIIIPCYNCEKLLDATLASLENQTWRDFEVICVNDGSKDHTLQKLREWEKKGTLRIAVLDQENRGVSSARNYGIKKASGEYIVFLDSDDMFNDYFLEHMVVGMDKTGVDVVYCKHSRNYDNVIGAAEVAVQKKTQDEAMRDLLYRMGEIAFVCYVYRRDWLNAYGILFDENTKFGEDREFNWKYLCHCQTAGYLDAPLYWYRVNNESATKSTASWRKTDLLIAVKRIEQYLDDQKCAFSDEFKSYMYARAMWAVAKTFAVCGNKELFKRLRKEFDVRKCMRRTSRDNNKIVAIASILYRIHPKLFFFAVQLKK